MSPSTVPIGTEVFNENTAMENNTTTAHYEIKETPIGTRRPIRVVCLGAGYSGAMMGIVFSQRMRNANAELVIYERNKDLGGTWFENRYASKMIRLRMLRVMHHTPLN